MGFFQSYKNLTKSQKITVGLIGVVVGLSGPYLMDPLFEAIEKQRQKDKRLRENIKKAQEENIRQLNDFLKENEQNTEMN